MPRPYPAPHPHHVGPVFIGGILVAAILALLVPAVANAQNDDSYAYDNRYSYSDSDYYPDDYADDDVSAAPYTDGSDDDVYYNSSAYYKEDGVPYAGKDLAYDYLKGDYYRYQGQPAQDRRAREQDGYRDGVLQTRPRGYRAYRNYYDQSCGCSRRAYYRVYNSWGEHEYRKLGGYNERRTYSRDRYSRY